MKVFVGTSGWQYSHWKGKFYPQNLKPENFLAFYSKHFPSVEVNSSFYHFIRKETFEKWREKISDKNFVFALKLHRLFTHLRKLKLKKEDEKLLEEFLKKASFLKENLGPFLIQFPPSFKNKERFWNFIKLFKKISKKIFKKMPRIALEVRNQGLINEEIFELFKKEKVAFVISDSLQWPTKIVKTTDFVYVRFHGKPELFISPYSREELKKYAMEIKRLKPRFLYAYFNNDARGYAIDNAKEFKELLA